MAAFTPEEIALLSKSVTLRDQLISQIAEGGVPTDRRDQRLLLEALTQQDASINAMANTRLKSKEVDENGAFKEAVVELFRLANMKQAEAIAEPLEIREGVEINMVDGLLEIGPDQLDETKLKDGDNYEEDEEE